MSTLDLSIGALEIGVLVSSVLYGVATLQAFMYTGGRFKDPLWLRALVGLVWVFETIHTVFIWIYLYGLTVTNYGVSATILQAPWSLGLALPCSAVLGASVQAFFAHRVRILSGRLIIPLIAWAGAIFRFCVGVILGNGIIKLGTIPLFFEHWQWLVSTNFALCAAIDLLNTVALCYYLLRRRSGFPPTNRLVDKLVRYTVETGLITSIFGVAIVITSESMKGNFVDFGVFVVYPKLFSNSFFSSLNARPSLRQTGSHMNTTQPWQAGVLTTPLADSRDPGLSFQLSERQTGQTDLSDTLAGKESEPYSNSSFEGSAAKGVTIV